MQDYLMPENIKSKVENNSGNMYTEKRSANLDVTSYVDSQEHIMDCPYLDLQLDYFINSLFIFSNIMIFCEYFLPIQLIFTSFN